MKEIEGGNERDREKKGAGKRGVPLELLHWQHTAISSPTTPF